MIYESSANSKQDNLYVTTLSVDSEESYVKPLVPDTSSSWTALHYSLLSFGILLFITVGGFYWVRSRGGNRPGHDSDSTQTTQASQEMRLDVNNLPLGSVTGVSDSSHNAGLLNQLVLESDGKSIKAMAGNSQIDLPGIKQYQGKDIFQLIYNLISENIQEIAVSDFDKEMFPDDQGSLASYKRKRLFEALHQELGFELFKEKKGAFDARFKILHLNRERVRIIDKSP